MASSSSAPVPALCEQHQRALQFGETRVVDARAREQAESGVHAVDGLARRDDAGRRRVPPHLPPASRRYRRAVRRTPTRGGANLRARGGREQIEGRHRQFGPERAHCAAAAAAAPIATREPAPYNPAVTAAFHSAAVPLAGHTPMMHPCFSLGYTRFRRATYTATYTSEGPRFTCLKHVPMRQTVCARVNRRALAHSTIAGDSDVAKQLF